MHKDSPFRIGCKKQFQTQVWVASFHVEESITKERLMEQIEYLRTIGQLKVRVKLTHIVTTHSKHYQEYRTFFDQFCPVVAGANLKPIFPSSSYAVKLPRRPDTPTTWKDIKVDPN